MQSKNYFSRGKLLLFGEYFVLDGCTALAVPTRLGQELSVSFEELPVKGFNWKSLDHENNTWFEGWFDEAFHLLHCTDKETAEILQRILLAAQQLNPLLCAQSDYYAVQSKLEFPRHWGLGSSSTLIDLIAQWAGVDAIQLFFLSFKGSGYDIACARAKSAILYKLVNGNAEWQEVELKLPFSKDIFFVHLGKKQNSREGIQHYGEKKGQSAEIHHRLNYITKAAAICRDRDEFIRLMETSESLISEFLDLPKVKDLYFSDFEGAIKSLGAWGGDFVMALPADSAFPVKDYFHSKGFDTVLSFEEMVFQA